MIVVMQTGAQEAHIQSVLGLLQSIGLRGTINEGTERKVVAVLGTPIPPDLVTTVQAMEGVESAFRISKPYKLASKEFHPGGRSIVRVGDVEIGGSEVVMMAGPCSVENEDQVMRIAEAVRERGAKLLRGGAYKPRTSPYAFRGLGEAGLEILAKAREKTGLAIVTEVMTPSDVAMVGQYADVFQIGARNMQNYFLLEEVGRSNKPVLLKRGPSATIEEWLLAAEYVMAQGNHQVMLCERGIRTFETATRNTFDLNALAYARSVTHLPVIADPSHGVGVRHLVPPMSLAAVAAGADGLIVEVHYDPDKAWSDGAQTLNFDQFGAMMRQLAAVSSALGRHMGAVKAQ